MYFVSKEMVNKILYYTWMYWALWNFEWFHQHSYPIDWTFSFSELMFLETSALTGENVEETFLKCARSILTKIESGKCQAAHIKKI